MSIFQRRKTIFSRRKFKYGPVIKDPGFRYPHSVAFTPETNHLMVTNAGANYFSIFEPERRHAEMRWPQSSASQKILGPESIFRQVNARNKMEGGPKALAIHTNSLAVCSPEHGIKIYSLRDILSKQ